MISLWVLSYTGPLNHTMSMESLRFHIQVCATLRCCHRHTKEWYEISKSKLHPICSEQCFPWCTCRLPYTLCQNNIPLSKTIVTSSQVSNTKYKLFSEYIYMFFIWWSVLFSTRTFTTKAVHNSSNLRYNIYLEKKIRFNSTSTQTTSYPLAHMGRELRKKG